MASTLTQYSSRININYPEVGKDNDTQGFRDNFYNIQSALAIAGKEISNLQDYGVNLTQTNNFQGNVIRNVIIQSGAELVRQGATLTSSSYVTVDYSLGSYHKVSISSGTYSFSIINWPATGNYAKLNLQITPTSLSTTTVTFLGSATVVSSTPTAFPISYQQTNPIFYEVWTTDNGANMYVIQLGN